MNPWDNVASARIVALLPAYLGTRRTVVGYIGDGTGSWIQAKVDAGLSWVSAGLDSAARLPSSVPEYARAQIRAGRDLLLESAATAIQTGQTAAGNMIGTLAGRASQALADLGKGAGNAFRSFWGISPSTLIGVGAVALLLLAFGGFAFVGWTPGGQLYAAGLGRALASVGEGTGGALRAAGPVFARAALTG
jgi:hypothetical protein